MASLSKRQQQAEDRRNQLIDVALELFGQRGIEGTRVSDIAQAAGVAQGLLYHYFPNKEALLSAIIDRYGPIPIVSELLADPPDRPARETLLALTERMYALLQERRPLIRLVVRELIWQPESLAIAMLVREQALGMFMRYLESRVAAGELRPHDTRMVAQLLASNVLLAGIAQLPADPYVTGVIDVVLQGIAVQAPNQSHLPSSLSGG